MKNYGDLGGCYLPRPTTSTNNTLLDFHNSSYDTQPQSLIVKYFFYVFYPLLKTLIPKEIVKLVRMHHLIAPKPFIKSCLFMQHDRLFPLFAK